MATNLFEGCEEMTLGSHLLWNNCQGLFGIQPMLLLLRCRNRNLLKTLKRRQTQKRNKLFPGHSQNFSLFGTSFTFFENRKLFLSCVSSLRLKTTAAAAAAKWTAWRGSWSAVELDPHEGRKTRLRQVRTSRPNSNDWRRTHELHLSLSLSLAHALSLSRKKSQCWWIRD